MNGEVVQSIRLDFSGLSGPQQVCYTQYGQTLPVIEALLCDKGQPYQIPEGAQVSIRLKKPSGTVIYSPAGSWEGNQIRYPLSGQAAAAFGGLNYFKFCGDGQVERDRIQLSVADFFIRTLSPLKKISSFTLTISPLGTIV